jgi:hypothetical protein
MGSYPGHLRPQHNQYQPSEFNNGQATAHFVQYGGGNALVLTDGPNPTTIQPQHGQEQPLLISGTFVLAGGRWVGGLIVFGQDTIPYSIR